MLWHRIDSAPIDSELLLYCPWRHESNRERIEIGYAHTSTGSHHAWATHWAYLPSGPEPAEVERALADEAEREHHERVAEEEYQREMHAIHR